MTNVTYDYSGKVALVTGAGSGIGFATAMAFAAAGARVAVADIAKDAGERTVAAILESGGSASFFQVDVAEPDQVDSLISSIVAAFGQLDFAHNNAGVQGDPFPVADISTERWRHVIDVNLNSIFFCLRAEINAMLSRGGAIVNTASAAGLIGSYNSSSYTTAKHGVVGLTKCAAMEYGKKGIRINAVCPGLVDTPLIDDMPSIVRDRLVFSTPIDRIGTPDEVANAVLWLCSDQASYMLGHPMPVDGGVVLGGAGSRFDDLL
jgi:NAD(P)-dependent dehydrogenase (short-subunit alcohol dehydrogenase family)